MRARARQTEQIDRQTVLLAIGILERRLRSLKDDLSKCPENVPVSMVNEAGLKLVGLRAQVRYLCEQQRARVDRYDYAVAKRSIYDSSL